MHRSWWPLVLFEDLDWFLRGTLISHLSFVSFPEHSWAQSRGCVVCYFASRKRETLSFIFTLFISAPLFETWRLSIKAFMVGGSLGPCEFPWEWLICPLLQRGDVVQLFHFLALPQHGSHMTWPTVNLESRNPKASTFFFLCVLCSFFSFVELLLSGEALSASLARWGDKKPAVLGLMSPTC